MRQLHLRFNFFGGIILGILLALVFSFFAHRVRDLGLENITFHVFLEVSMTFIVFLIAETFHVSGILGVVACGIVWSLLRDQRISPYHSRLNIALSSVWKIISFTLNGIVFVLLGIQLPNAMQSTWDDVYINNLTSLGMQHHYIGINCCSSFYLGTFNGSNIQESSYGKA